MRPTFMLLDIQQKVLNFRGEVSFQYTLHHIHEKLFIPYVEGHRRPDLKYIVIGAICSCQNVVFPHTIDH